MGALCPRGKGALCPGGEDLSLSLRDDAEIYHLQALSSQLASLFLGLALGFTVSFSVSYAVSLPFCGASVYLLPVTSPCPDYSLIYSFNFSSPKELIIV